MSTPRYEVRCADGTTESFAAEDHARNDATDGDAYFSAECGPHRVWRVDSDGTQTDITDEQGAQE